MADRDLTCMESKLKALSVQDWHSTPVAGRQDNAWAGTR